MLSLVVIILFYIGFLLARMRKIDRIGAAKREGYIDSFE